MIKDLFKKQCNIFCHNLHNVGFLVNGNFCKNKIRFVMQPLCSSTKKTENNNSYLSFTVTSVRYATQGSLYSTTMVATVAIKPFPQSHCLPFNWRRRAAF
jgi:hypothetical protein